MSRRNAKQVKQTLFLNCGRVDMYNMEKYKEKDLVLHHEPPYRQTKHTIYEESYILSQENHLELHRIELDNKDEYNRRMEIIRKNKKILEKTKLI